MNPEIPHGDTESPKPDKEKLKEAFLEAYTFKPEGGFEASVYDQGVASMRESVTKGFGLELKDDDEYYAVMAGLTIATEQMGQLIESGLDPQNAARTLRTSLAGLAPIESQS